jgi:pimeloyl-ACP methyl ester carboxylesterase
MDTVPDDNIVAAFDQVVVTHLKQFIALTAHATRLGYINRLKLLRRFDVRDRVHDIRQPTLFLSAENDHLVPAVAQARYMAQRVPSSVMRILEGHGHICLIAPDLDLTQILHEWPPAPDPGWSKVQKERRIATAS